LPDIDVLFARYKPATPCGCRAKKRLKRKKKKEKKKREVTPTEKT
jgi:hypothetical protein